MSMSALCASSVSCTRIGSARALICRSLPFSVGYSTTETSVMVPSATVTCTCTGPQRVSAESPVTVVVPDELPDVPEDDVVPSVGAVDVPAAVLPDEVSPEEVPPCTGATTEESAVAEAVDEVDVW